MRRTAPLAICMLVPLALALAAPAQAQTTPPIIRMQTGRPAPVLRPVTTGKSGGIDVLCASVSGVKTGLTKEFTCNQPNGQHTRFHFIDAHDGSASDGDAAQIGGLTFKLTRNISMMQMVTSFALAKAQSPSLSLQLHVVAETTGDFYAPNWVELVG